MTAPLEKDWTLFLLSLKWGAAFYHGGVGVRGGTDATEGHQVCLNTHIVTEWFKKHGDATGHGLLSSKQTIMW